MSTVNLDSRAASGNDPSGQVLSPKNVLEALARDGIVILDSLVPPSVLAGMQTAFASRLKNIRWNHHDGYEKTEKYRHMVQDVLSLDQGFVDVALHPVVKNVLRHYIGEHFELAEAKGWLSLPTRKDFHGWHGDAWYDQSKLDLIPREVKLAMYLTDVKTGAFHYIKGSHQKWHPREFDGSEITDEMKRNIVEATGVAGTVILFDTSGIHRQGMPILEPRQAVFLNYHDRRNPIQQESLRSYRYHPLLLNAAFLGNLSAEDMRILGFGDKTGYQPAYLHPGKKGLAYSIGSGIHGLTLRSNDFFHRVRGKLFGARK